MNMIKKIALTASILLFVLAQAFSFYVIYISSGEKMDLLREREGKLFEQAVKEFESKLSENVQDAQPEKNVVTWFFREIMLEQSALYREDEELFNNSRYEFQTADLKDEEPEYPCNFRQEKVNGRYLQIFYTKYSPEGYYQAWYSQKEEECYMLLHVLDITEIYERSFRLVLQEILVAFAASVGMGLLLIYLIKKITRPLQAVNETQRQLIGSMSHELKTPLTAIRGYSETLLGVKLSPEQTERALLYINRESARLSRLSEKMMELTKLYESECRVMLQEVLVEDLFGAVAENVEHRLSEKGIALVLEGNFAGMKKQLDEDLMTSFLINLVNNSVMASKEGSRIFMGADEHSIWVRDEGCGIPNGEVEKVRKAFYRVDKSRSRKSGNMGLGLALCEQIAAVHGGCMEIESAVGEGTRVAFTDRLHWGEYSETKKE